MIYIVDGLFNFKGAFFGNKQLVSVSLPTSIVKILTATFQNCASLSVINIPTYANKFLYV